MLDAHGYCMQESSIEVLRLVKDELLRIGGVMKFSITTDGEFINYYTTDLILEDLISNRRKL